MQEPMRDGVCTKNLRKSKLMSVQVDLREKMMDASCSKSATEKAKLSAVLSESFSDSEDF